MAELDDDREGIEPEALDEDAGDPAAAFDALRRTIETQGAQIGAEMTVMRRGLEAAFDQLERIEPAQDYKPQLAQLVQTLDNVAERLNGVEQSPILRHGAQHYAALLERSGEALIRTAAQQLERQASDLERAGRNLSAHTKSAYDRKSQDFRMWMAGLVGLFVGIFLILLLPRFLPFSADSHVAALVMGRDRVSAGHAVIRAADPFEAQKITWGGQFYDASSGEISACLETARRTGTDQRCTVTVPAPAQ
ncbi:DUF6118 family protein [Pseudogemmobacter bohemicus]|uniref:DUF6118 family protein n=1 Tax=Pseudogemmobacter bohemicus TaxID=2250708 RepID=UPI000DD40FF1|nr:DUF6118 family protein [Pseudogemmobacter bohemicus]